jgi:hypothetical protein
MVISERVQPGVDVEILLAGIPVIGLEEDLVSAAQGVPKQGVRPLLVPR